jgi:hypothetical protein
MFLILYCIFWPVYILTYKIYIFASWMLNLAFTDTKLPLEADVITPPPSLPNTYSHSSGHEIQRMNIPQLWNYNEKVWTQYYSLIINHLSVKHSPKIWVDIRKEQSLRRFSTDDLYWIRTLVLWVPHIAPEIKFFIKDNLKLPDSIGVQTSAHSVCCSLLRTFT